MIVCVIVSKVGVVFATAISHAGPDAVVIVVPTPVNVVACVASSVVGLHAPTLHALTTDVGGATLPGIVGTVPEVEVVPTVRQSAAHSRDRSLLGDVSATATSHVGNDVSGVEVHSLRSVSTFVDVSTHGIETSTLHVPIIVVGDVVFPGTSGMIHGLEMVAQLTKLRSVAPWPIR